MTSAELKASILDRAVRGLLTAAWRTTHTHHSPSSPASRPSSPVSDPPFPIPDPPYDLPPGWVWKRLGEISYNVGNRENQIPAKSVLSQGKVPVVSQGQKLIDGYCNDIEKRITDLPVVMFGDHTRNVKYIDFEFVIGADGTKFFKPLTDAKWLYYWTLHASNQIGPRGYGRHWGLLNDQPVALPPLAEQREIVAKIEELMPLVEEYGKAETLLAQLNDNFPTALRKSILQHAVEGRLTAQWRTTNTHHSSLISHHSPSSPVSRPSPIDNPPFPIPDSWKWVRLGEVVNLLNGDRGANYPSKDKLHPDGDIPFISAVNMKDGSVSKDQLLYLSTSQYEKLRAGKLQRNDVVLCIRGSLGKHCIYPFDSGAIASSLVILRTGNYINRKYLSFYIDAPLFGKEIIKYDNGTAQPNLAATNAAKFLLPLPPLAEQREIVARVEELLKLVEEMK